MMCSKTSLSKSAADFTLLLLQTRSLSVLLLLGFLLRTPVAAQAPLPATDSSALDFKQWGLLAIQEGGRRKPIDTFARDWIESKRRIFRTVAMISFVIRSNAAMPTKTTTPVIIFFRFMIPTSPARWRRG